MSAAVPYLLLGEARNALLRQRLLRAVQTWQQHWFAHTATLDLVMQPAVDPSWPESLHAAFMAGEQAVLHLGATTEFVARALCLQAMSAPGGPSTLSAQLARSLQLEMLQHLGQTLLELSGVQAVAVPAADDEAGSAPLDTRRWWCATLTQPHSFERLSLFIHPMIISGLTPIAKTTGAAALASRRAAIGGEAVCVEAWLGEVQLSLRDFTTLRAGDVLVLESDQCAYLTAHDRTRIASLQPGRESQQRAVRIDTLLQRPQPLSSTPNSRGS